MRECDSRTLALFIHVYLLSLKHPSCLAGLCLSLLEPSSGLVEVLTADESQQAGSIIAGQCPVQRMTRSRQVDEG